MILLLVFPGLSFSELVSVTSSRFHFLSCKVWESLIFHSCACDRYFIIRHCQYVMSYICASSTDGDYTDFVSWDSIRKETSQYYAVFKNIQPPWMIFFSYTFFHRFPVTIQFTLLKVPLDSLKFYSSFILFQFFCELKDHWNVIICGGYIWKYILR